MNLQENEKQNETQQDQERIETFEKNSDKMETETMNDMNQTQDEIIESEKNQTQEIGNHEDNDSENIHADEKNKQLDEANKEKDESNKRQREEEIIEQPTKKIKLNETQMGSSPKEVYFHFLKNYFCSFFLLLFLALFFFSYFFCS